MSIQFWASQKCSVMSLNSVVKRLSPYETVPWCYILLKDSPRQVESVQKASTFVLHQCIDPTSTWYVLTAFQPHMSQFSSMCLPILLWSVGWRSKVILPDLCNDSISFLPGLDCPETVRIEFQDKIPWKTKYGTAKPWTRWALSHDSRQRAPKDNHVTTSTSITPFPSGIVYTLFCITITGTPSPNTGISCPLNCTEVSDVSSFIK